MSSSLYFEGPHEFFFILFSPLKPKQRMVSALKKSTEPQISFILFSCCFPLSLSRSLSPVIHLSAAPPEKPPRLTAQVIISISIYTVISFQPTEKTI